MARARLAPGAHGKIRYTWTGRGVKAVSSYRRFDGTYAESSGSGATEEKARARLLENIANGLSVGRTRERLAELTPNSTVAEVALGWAKHVEALGQGEPGTRHEELRLIRARIIPGLGALTIREIGPQKVLNWYLSEHSRTPRQAANCLTVLRRIARWAVAMELRKGNFCDEIQRVRVSTAEDPVVPSPMELDELRRLVGDWMDRPGRKGPRPSSLLLDFIEVALGTGGRTGEVVALRWIDIDLYSDAPSVTIQGEVQEGKGRPKQRVERTKTSAGKRQVAIPSATVSVLRDRKARFPDSMYVFETRNGTPVGMQEVQRQLRHVRKWAGLPDSWVPYSFRRAAVTAVAESEGARAAARFAGHKQSSITEKHYWKKDLRVGNLVESLEKLAPNQLEAIQSFVSSMFGVNED